MIRHLCYYLNWQVIHWAHYHRIYWHLFNTRLNSAYQNHFILCIKRKNRYSSICIQLPILITKCLRTCIGMHNKPAFILKRVLTLPASRICQVPLVSNWLQYQSNHPYFHDIRAAGQWPFITANISYPPLDIIQYLRQALSAWSDNENVLYVQNLSYISHTCSTNMILQCH